MNFESFEDILNYAIEKEKEAVEFYDDISRQEPYASAKEIFREFAEEEKKHVDMLENLGRDRDKLSEYRLEWIPDLKRSDYMVDMQYEKGMHYISILKLAMKREEKALKLYRELQKKVDNEDDIKLFNILRQEEAKHKLALETLYDDYMAEQGD